MPRLSKLIEKIEDRLANKWGCWYERNKARVPLYAVLGGIGVFYGGVVGGLIIGLTEVYTAAYIGSNYRNIPAFIILILVLFLRPTGLFGAKQVKKV